MPVSPKNGKLLYHLTPLENLKSILQSGLSCRNDILNFNDVAEPEIILQRDEIGLNHFVPFHFFAGSPFDGRVQKAALNKEFVFITIHRDFAQQNNFKILKSHPLSMNPFKILDYDDGIAAIDWDTMEKRDYSDHDCKEICMAECLSPKSIKPTDFFMVFTPNQSVYKIVENFEKEIAGHVRFRLSILANLFVS